MLTQCLHAHGSKDGVLCILKENSNGKETSLESNDTFHKRIGSIEYLPPQEDGLNKKMVKEEEEDTEDANKFPKLHDSLLLWKDIEHNFVDFIGINIFHLQISKILIDIVNLIKNGEKHFGFVKLIMKRIFLNPRLERYSKYLFIWNGRIQLQAKGSRKDLKQ